MKHLFVFIFVAFLISPAYSQTDFSGVYGKREPLSKEMREFFKEQKPVSDDFGYDLKLILKKVSGFRYKFWLYVNKGFPSYNSGQIDGFVEFKADSALYLLSDSIYGGCKLLFKNKESSFFVEHDYEYGGCGFGANVTAHGTYPLKSRLVKTNDIKSVYQFEVEELIIKNAKAFIYSTATEKQPTKQYFIKGDKILNITEQEDRIYTEYISANGKFISGWINKGDIQ
ncbi:hypothetical protein ESA94_06220 [Lacibacter luteus]|uniref:SH3 domain-containing protein n=1 Tax=Lacibacter luteus TaxID=2508719 RepID=A0A4Q1CPD8_9BACT|nr:hypothetical protein [Lacibacter luteus]RXK62591.1 hypothetical protein ESA94_06220 [Lacibacter luteus]